MYAAWHKAIVNQCTRIENKKEYKLHITSSMLHDDGSIPNVERNTLPCRCLTRTPFWLCQLGWCCHCALFVLQYLHWFVLIHHHINMSCPHSLPPIILFIPPPLVSPFIASPQRQKGFTMSRLPSWTERTHASLLASDMEILLVVSLNEMRKFGLHCRILRLV